MYFTPHKTVSELSLCLVRHQARLQLARDERQLGNILNESCNYAVFLVSAGAVAIQCRSVARSTGSRSVGETIRCPTGAICADRAGIKWQNI